MGVTPSERLAVWICSMRCSWPRRHRTFLTGDDDVHGGDEDLAAAKEARTPMVSCQSKPRGRKTGSTPRPIMPRKEWVFWWRASRRSASSFSIFVYSCRLKRALGSSTPPDRRSTMILSTCSTSVSKSSAISGSVRLSNAARSRQETAPSLDPHRTFQTPRRIPPSAAVSRPSSRRAWIGLRACPPRAGSAAFRRASLPKYGGPSGVEMPVRFNAIRATLGLSSLAAACRTRIAATSAGASARGYAPSHQSTTQIARMLVPALRTNILGRRSTVPTRAVRRAGRL